MKFASFRPAGGKKKPGCGLTCEKGRRCRLRKKRKQPDSIPPSREGGGKGKRDRENLSSSDRKKKISERPPCRRRWGEKGTLPCSTVSKRKRRLLVRDRPEKKEKYSPSWLCGPIGWEREERFALRQRNKKMMICRLR